MQAIAVVLALASGWLAAADPAPRRVARLCEREYRGPAHSAPTPVIENARRRAVLCVVACVAVGWVVGGVVGAVVATPGGAALSWWLGTLEPPSVTREREDVSRHLPLAVDLLAACAQVGLSVEASLRPVSQAVGGALSRRLALMTARLELGAAPAEEWARLVDDPELGALGRTMLRAHESGAPVVDGLTRLAADRRRERRTQAQLKARNVGVKSAGPLAACFLPAFMLVGVVPTIAGGFAHLVL